jgi:hypothetical protein
MPRVKEKEPLFELLNRHAQHAAELRALTMVAENLQEEALDGMPDGEVLGRILSVTRERAILVCQESQQLMTKVVAVQKAAAAEAARLEAAQSRRTERACR